MLAKKPRLLRDLDPRGSDDDTPTLHCDLSERGLTTESADRALKAFPHATSVDLSRNGLDHCPRICFPHLTVLNVSSNKLVSLAAVAFLTHLQVLDLSFNRLVDVEPLMFCITLVNVDLRGNRVTTTKGIESLQRLERLDLSDNLIEQPDAVRSLSLNTQLSTLLLKGNPIATTADYRVRLLDLVPQVSVLDGRRQSRQHYRYVLGKDTTSYVHMYDVKKQFQCMQAKAQGVPASTRKPCFHHHTQDHSTLHDTSQDADNPDETSSAMVAATLKCLTTAEAPRLRPPMSNHHHLPVHAGYCPKSLRPAPSAPNLKSEKHKRQKAQQQQQQHLTDTPGYVSLFERVAVSTGVKIPDDKCVSATRAKKTSAPPVPPAAAVKHVVAKRKNVISPPKVKVQVQPSGVRRHLDFDKRVASPAVPTDPTAGSLNASQRKVLGVIQGLIQHKRQTLASLHSAHG